MRVGVGDPAPDFALTHRIGNDPVRLSDYRGDRIVVLLFFPLAFSGVCTEEICRVAEDYGRWSELGAEVLGVSVDSPWVNVKFAEETGANFPILSDFNLDAADAYGVRNDDFFGMRGVANRSAFVIDRTGTIVYAWTSGDSDVLPAFEEIRAAVEAAG